MGEQSHWDGVYRAREEERLTWFEAKPELSLDLVRRHAPEGEPIIDIGGGAARLVDALLPEGCGPVTVLDISAEALAASKSRLGKLAAGATWVRADVRDWTPDRRYGLWHDRAVFHFLTDARDRDAYCRTLDATLSRNGAAILMTFAEDGPERCSGLPVRRYSPVGLAAEVEMRLPGCFRLMESGRRNHVTPAGATQAFQYSVLKRVQGDR